MVPAELRDHKVTLLTEVTLLSQMADHPVVTAEVAVTVAAVADQVAAVAEAEVINNLKF